MSKEIDVSQTGAFLHGVDTLLIGGIGVACGRPLGLLDIVCAGLDAPVSVVSNDIVEDEGWFVDLSRRGLVARLVTSFVAGEASVEFARELERRECLDLVPQGNLLERLRAAAYGTGPVYLPVGADSDYARHRETRDFEGRRYVLEHPCHGDLALVRAETADRFGNLSFRGTMRTTNLVMAMAAARTIVECDHVVSELAPEAVELPGIWVDAIFSTSARPFTWTDYEEQIGRVTARR